MTTTVSECEPAECTSDADCAADMVCFTETHEECSAPGGRACVEGQECEAIKTEPTCEQKTSSSCVPRYVPPCTVDADCGPGFSCTEIIEEACSDSGSGTAPSAGVDAGAAAGTGGSGAEAKAAEPSDAGVADAGMMIEGSSEPSDDGAKDFAAPEPSCTTRVTGTFRCELQRIDCEVTTDCPSGFTCEALYAHAVCGSTDVGVPAADAGIGGEAGTSGSGGSSSGGDDSKSAPVPGAEPGPADGEPLPADGGEALPDDKVPPTDGGEPLPEEERVPAPPPDTTCEEAPVTEKVCMPPYAREEFARGSLGDDSALLPELGQSSNTTGSSKDGAAGSSEPPSAPVLACSVGTPGAGAGGLLGFLSMLGTVAIAIARRGSRRG
jgi:hypothetical protein